MVSARAAFSTRKEEAESSWRDRVASFAMSAPPINPSRLRAHGPSAQLETLYTFHHVPPNTSRSKLFLCASVHARLSRIASSLLILLPSLRCKYRREGIWTLGDAIHAELTDFRGTLYDDETTLHPNRNGLQRLESDGVRQYHL